jgi:hypothetical protein
VLIYYGMLLRSAEFEHITHILTPPILVWFQFRQMFRIQRSILGYGMGPVGKQKQVDSVGKLWYCPSLGKMWNTDEHSKNVKSKQCSLDQKQPIYRICIVFKNLWCMFKGCETSFNGCWYSV